MQYDVCHFLKDKSQVIVKFITTSDRNSVWTQRSRLKGSDFFVGQDLPASIQKQQDQFYTILKEAINYLNIKITFQLNQQNFQ